MEKVGFDKNGEIFLSVAPFSDMFGVLMVTSGKSRHPSAGSAEILMGSCPGLPSFGERPARVKSRGVQHLHEGCTRLWWVWITVIVE